jgi:hypothetical protein
MQPIAFGFHQPERTRTVAPSKRNQEHNMNFVKPVSAILAVVLGLGITNLVASSMERSGLNTTAATQIAQLEGIVVTAKRAS